MRYRDGLGHIYEVPAKHLDEFEARRTILLKIDIAIKVAILIVLIAWPFFF